MADCIYCGKPAGLLRKAHKDCERKFQIGRELMYSAITDAVAGATDLVTLEDELHSIAKSHHLAEVDTRELLCEAWGAEVDAFVDSEQQTMEVPEYLNELRIHFNLSQEELDSKGAYARFAKWLVIHDLLEGEIPDIVRVQGTLPFNFLKSETLVWLFQDVPYYELRTQTRYVGASQGMSVRLAKGLYYRAGAFRGNPVKTANMVHLDTGQMAVTTKHIYFSGQAKGFRVRFDKIVSFQPYSDALGIQRDAQTAKPQVFVTGDGWFTYNLVTNLAQL